MLTRSYLLALAASFAFFLAQSAFALMPRHLVALGASSAEIGRVMGLFQLAAAVFLPLTGLLLGRSGARGLMIRGSVLYAASCVGLSFIDRLGPLVYAARAMQGLGFALFFVSAGATVVAAVPAARRAQGIALWGAAVLVTNALAPLLGEALLLRATFSELYLAAGCCCAIAALASAPLRAEPELDRRPSGMWALARIPAVLAALAGLLSAGLAFGTAFSFLSAFAAEERLGPVSPFFVAYTAASVAVRFLGGGLADRVDRRVVIVPALLLGAAAIGLLGLARSPLHLAAAGLLFGVGSGFSYPALMAFVVDQVAEEDRPRAVALDNWAFTLGMLASALAVGHLAEALSMRAAFVVVACVAALPSAALVRARPRRPEPAGT